jgi:hypothetical protein
MSPKLKQAAANELITSKKHVKVKKSFKIGMGNNYQADY